MVLNEQASYKFYKLCGVPSCNTTLFHLRIVDDEVEANPNNQYDGDFWGLYLALEEPDGRFLDDKDLPDGNLYKMNGSPNKRNQGPDQVSGTTDVNSFISTKRRTQPLTWWEKNTNLAGYYNYKIGTTLINNTDLRSEWNCLYYHRPEIEGDPNSGKWEMFPWDLDLTWESKFHIRSENVWENWQNVFRYSDAETDFENRSREVWDLLCSSGEGAKVVEEMQRFLEGDGVTRIVEANQAMWDYHPRKSKKGIWYKNNPKLSSSKRNWEGLVGYMKDFVSPGGYGANRLINEKADTNSAVPRKPTITRLGDSSFPTDDIRFQSSSFSGNGTSFTSMQWRLGEITDPESSGFDPNKPWVYEINAVWESGEINNFQSSVQVPTTVVRVGKTYRARVRHLGSSGQWSHWSEPVQFVATEPDITPYKKGLVISEMMYNPQEASESDRALGFTNSDFEFIELKNIGEDTLSLANVRFTKGINYNFIDGEVSSLSPGQFLVLARNADAFKLRYGAIEMLVGEYAPNNLSNGGENVKLSYGAGIVIQEFEYLDEEPWPAGADGQGYSLVLKNPEELPDHKISENWKISSTLGGSPGKGEIEYTYNDWKKSSFNSEQLRDSLISGELADPDKDGYSNLLEYSFGGRALVKDDNMNPIARIIEREEEYLLFTYRKRVGVSDYNYVIEKSSDLRTWTEVINPELDEISVNEDETNTLSYRILKLNSAAIQNFLRLKVRAK